MRALECGFRQSPREGPQKFEAAPMQDNPSQNGLSSCRSRKDELRQKHRVLDEDSHSRHFRYIFQQLKSVVPRRGLEPPHPCEYMHLKHARLPIPPPRLRFGFWNTREREMYRSLSVMSMMLLICTRYPQSRFSVPLPNPVGSICI